ncbi:hypothetical protein ACN28E_36945 [Archangium lansingense]|uniref:hypothetical protein n=1 Tax=Archangium lansingense TaxID=2995310 RepID=UPI003B775821
MCAWVSVAGCATTQVDARASQVDEPEELKNLVLVIQGTQGQDTDHVWLPASELDWPALADSRASAGYVGRVELASQRQRDCDQEQIDCFSRCWKQDPPEGYRRHKREHYAYCQEECLRGYMDCLKATGQYALEFKGMREAIDWLKRHREEISVGGVIVVAGVVFVAVSATGGALILAPVILF